MNMVIDFSVVGTSWEQTLSHVQLLTVRIVLPHAMVLRRIKLSAKKNLDLIIHVKFD